MLRRRGVEGRARLRHRRRQLERGQFGDHVAGADLVALADLDACELTPTLGATRISVTRTTPTMGARHLGTPHETSSRADRDEDQTDPDDYRPLSHAP
jgi:hypothetical protein